MNNTQLLEIKGVRGRLNFKGIPELHLEDVARGLGFTQIAASGNEVVRWERLNKYLSEMSIPTSGDGDYIPENIFYKLCFKANNKTAMKFQDLVTDEILPSIRKHGGYLTAEKIEEALLNPDMLIQLATNLKEEQAKRQHLEVENTKQAQIIGELKPKADYTDLILKNKGLVTITQIAKDYGMSGEAMNNLLHKLRIQYKQSDQWLLYEKYHGKGYTHSKTINIVRKDGRPDVKMNTKWTQKGRLFIYEELKKEGVLPTIEQDRIA